MPKKWHDIIMVYGYEVIVPGDVHSYAFINDMITRKTDHFFRMYTLVCSISNGWDEKKVDADDVFPIIGFEVNDVNECLEHRSELDDFLNENTLFDGLFTNDKLKLFCGIQVDAIQPSDDDE